VCCAAPCFASAIPALTRSRSNSGICAIMVAASPPRSDVGTERRPSRARIQNLCLTLRGFRLHGDKGRIHIPFRPWLSAEMAIFVHASYQCGAIARHRHLPHMGRNVANSQTNPSISRLIGRRGVENLVVVQRHLPSLQLHINRGGFIDIDGDFLPAGEHGTRLPGVIVCNDLPHVGAFDHPHRAAGLRGVRQRDPYRDRTVRLQVPIGRVLVPADVAPVAWLGVAMLSTLAQESVAQGRLEGPPRSATLLVPIVPRYAFCPPHAFGGSTESAAWVERHGGRRS
jgi:hypothetical protein